MTDDRAIVLPELPEPWTLEFVGATGPGVYVAEATNDQTGDKADAEGEEWTLAYAALYRAITAEGS